MSRLSSRSLLLTAAVSSLALGGTLWVKPALAGTATSNITVGANVPASCTIQTARVDFDPYNSTTGSRLGSGAMYVTCTSGTSATVTLNQGANPGEGSSDAAPARRLSNGSGSYLAYEVYQDSDKTKIWGNTAGTGVVFTSDGSAQSFTTYGTIASGLNPAAGQYTDTIVATVSY
ncbi:MAG: spore coat U domain-containing protein [Aphanizomenon gracile PMC644.10]|nr:spore coat U domain-containing protein [Aphanizomenon gracile PMC644.10]